jgi:hypothetical protein
MWTQVQINGLDVFTQYPSPDPVTGFLNDVVAGRRDARGWWRPPAEENRRGRQ